MAELSKSQIDKLGDRLRIDPHTEDDLRLLDEFRNSYSQTFGAVREILQRRSVELVARNIKSTMSIVAKLRRLPKLRLSRIQDIAGCRIVVPNIVRQNEEVESLTVDFPGADVKDRRLDPSHGYRAVHVIVKVEEKLFEIQVRTLLQQQWAELSEKAADVIDYEIKYGGYGKGFQIPLMVISRQVAEHEAEEANPAATTGQTTIARAIDLERREKLNRLRAMIDMQVQGLTAILEDPKRTAT